MSIEIVKKQIYNFLASDMPEVLAISGAWGVGKTYSWNQYLNYTKDHDGIAMELYAYVSLFGINSLAAFKYAIFENTKNKKMIGAETSIESFTKNAKDTSFNFGKQLIPLLTNAPALKNITTPIESLSFLAIKNTIICIDDLERAGKDLNIQDVLGVVSQLKDQKKMQDSFAC